MLNFLLIKKLVQASLLFIFRFQFLQHSLFFFFFCLFFFCLFFLLLCFSFFFVSIFMHFCRFEQKFQREFTRYGIIHVVMSVVCYNMYGIFCKMSFIIISKFISTWIFDSGGDEFANIKNIIKKYLLSLFCPIWAARSPVLCFNILF